jgi:ComF family protein
MKRTAAALGARLLDDTAAALFPCSCLHCDAPLDEEPLRVSRQQRRWAGLWNGKLRRQLLPGVQLPLRLLCPTCCTGLLLAASAPATIAATALPSVVAFEPSPVLFRLIHAFKYEGCRELGAFLGGFLALAARRHGCQHHPGVLVPIPLHAERLRSRGFNQSQLLAQAVGRSLRLPLMGDILQRQRNTPALAQIDEAARWQHVAGAFALRRRPPAPPVRMWLVDDVITSGSTVRATQDALSVDALCAGVLSLCRAR